MKKIKEYSKLIETSTPYYVIDGNLIFATRKEIVMVRDDIEILLLDENVYSFLGTSEYDLFYQLKNGDTLLCLLENGGSKLFDDKFFLSSAKYINNFLYIRARNSIGLKETYKIDLLTKDISCSSYKYFPEIVLRGNLMLFKAGKTVYFLEDRTEIWQALFEENVQKIDSWNDKIVLVSTSSMYESELTALDINTGEIIWKLEKMTPAFQIQDDYVYCFRKEAFYCISIQDGSVIYSYNLFEKFQANNFDETTNMLVKGEYVYFSGIMDCVISMWELRTGKLVWHHRLYLKEQTGRDTRKKFIPAGQAPKVQGNRLYQLDGSNTLHVFETETSLEIDS